MEPMELYPNFAVAVKLATGDASKELMPADANTQYVVTSIFIIGHVAAAQTLYVGDANGTVKILDYPASNPAVGVCNFWQSRKGIAMTKGQQLIIKPAAAGPSVFVLCEGYIIRT